MSDTYYKGWRILRGPEHPVTGQWRALRQGVGMGHTTREGLIAMIDARERFAIVGTHDEVFTGPGC
jgi:hypothetical protein